MMLPFQDTPEAMATCYRAADITMVTSEFETFGRIAAESQACGIPVIAFATGGLPEVVKDGVGGLVVPTGDVNALEEALRRLLDAQAERERLGRDGIRWVRERFDNRMITQEYLDLYRRLITDPKFCMEARGS
jgi:glycosyltransferase involved in cell wall biosynthesis